MLGKLGHDVECVERGAEALAHVERVVPDLIILDVMMPDMDGIDVLRELRARPQTRPVPVVMYSTLGDLGDRDRFTAMGANDYWVKAADGFDTIRRRLDVLLVGDASGR